MPIRTFRLRRIGRHGSIGIVLAWIAFWTLPSGAPAATSANAHSPLGVNLSGVNYYSSEQPFLNIFKTGSAWITHGTSAWDTNEEKYLNLDSNGFPITLTAIGDPYSQHFTSVGILLLFNLPSTSNGYYPSGQYVVLYDGQGTLSYGNDAKLVSSAPGRDVIDVARPSTNGIDVRITSTDPNHSGNYIRNIRLVKAENESALDAGEVFNPVFLSTLQNFRALRFMDWFATNGNTVSTWAQRSLPSNAFWGTSKGVPLEVAIELANKVSADAWLNVPVRATNDYMTQMAILVQAQLNTNLKAYIELSNEVWNGTFAQNGYSIQQGLSLFPNAQNKWYAGWEWQGYRTAQMADIWYSIYGASAFSSRVVIVMAGQAANSAVLQEELSTPDWTGSGNGPAVNHHIGVAAIAPYFFGTPSSTSDITSILASGDGGITELFSTIYSKGSYTGVPVNGTLGQANSWTSQHSKMLAAYGIPLVAYEGGESLQGFPTYSNGSPAVELFLAATRNPLIIPAYATYFRDWQSNGGTLFMHYNDVGTYTQYGEWGALESIMQTTSPIGSAPPKWQAIQNFISTTSCWWSGCASTPVAVPMPPTNLAVH